MAAELRLGVSFDLVYFRQQLQKLGRIAASEFTAPIKIKLDRQVVDRELNNLQKSIKRRKYNIELNIAGNLSKKSFDELQERLDTLSQRKKIEVPVSIKNAATGKEVSDAIAALRSRITQNQSIRQGDGKLRIGTSIRAAISNDDIAKFKNAVKEKFAGITNKADVSIGIKNAASGKDVADTIAGIRSRINQNQAVKQGSGKLRVGLSIKPAITNADIAGFKRTVEEKFSGLSVKIKADVQAGFASGQTGAAGLYEYMRSQGLSGGNVPGAAQAGRRAQFEARVAQANTEQLQSMLRRADVPGRSGLRTKAAMQERLLQLGDAAMENLLGSLEMRMREPRKVQRSFLDKVARAVFYMAGVDPEYLRQQAAQRRALPNVSFPATVPPGPPIGPSSTGRALPPGLTPGALPGSAFARQRFLPPQLGQDLNSILRNAAFAFVDSLNSRIRQVNVREIGRQALPPSMIRGLLPAGVGREPSIYGGPAVSDRASFFQRRIDEARARSAARGAAIMAGEPRGGVLGAGGSGAAGPFRPFAQPPRGGAIVPYQPQSTQLPAGYFERTKINQALAGADKYLSKAKFPLSGAIKELGSEFATATKQVLLFGTAYKALAFFTSLPGQAFEAAKSLQTFENQLEAVTGGAAQADRSFAFIDNLANRFNVPLQSARDGFVKLYASMAPAGFNSGEIENLFEGISKATATFGLSADQVDRVNNAFSQMASKGQIMSEELKGQLGDVLPGSLALFARAAQMSIPEFSKAMEDGAFKGEAMAQVLRNVAKIMNSDFGGAAANAANTLQGALNGIQNAVKRMYEAFEPVVAIIAGQIFPVFSGVIDDATQAIKAFGMQMEGINPATNLMSDNAQSLYRNIELAVDTFNTLSGVVQALVPTFQAFGNILGGALQLFNAIVGNPVGEFFVKLAVNVGIATAAINALSSAALVNAIRQLGLFIGNIKLAIAALRTLITTSRAAKIAVGGIVAGVVMVGLEMLVTRITAAKEETEKLRNAALGAADALKQMTYQQLVGQEKNVQRLIRNLETLQAASSGNLKVMRPSAQQIQMAQELGLPVTGRAGQQAISLVRAEGMRQQLLEQLPQIRGEMKGRFETTTTSLDLEKVDLAPGEDKKGKKKSMDDLIGGDIKRRLDEAKAALEYDMAIRIGEAEGNKDAERMLKYYEQYRKASLDLQSIQETIAQVNKFMPELIANGIDPTEKLADLRSKETEILYEIATISQKHANDARKAAKDRESDLKKEEERRRRIVELIEDAAIAAGKIGPLEAARIRQRRGFASDLAQAQKDGTPEQVAQLKALQAATPVAGSLAEAYQKVREELEVLTDGTRVITTAAQGFGDAFSKAFTDIVTGAESWREGLGNAFRSVASMFADMVAQMLAKWAAMQIIGMLLPGAGSFAGGAKIGGSVAMPSSVGIGAGGGILQNAAGQGFGTFGPNFGIRQFATGGVVTGPTLGLVGEGRFNEAVVPLPNGKSIPVDLGQGAGNNISTNIVVNMNNGQSNSQVSGRGGQALGREIEGAVRNVILKETRPGGLIYSGR